MLPEFGSRPLASITPADVREWHGITLTDKPTMRSHAYSLLRTIFTSAVHDELIDANPARIVGAGRSKRVHRIKPASVPELGSLVDAMPLDTVRQRFDVRCGPLAHAAGFQPQGIAHAGYSPIHQ